MTSQATPEQPHHKQIFLHDPADHEEKLDILEYWRTIQKRKGQILAFGVIFAVLAAAIVFAMTPIYRATATLMIEAGKAKVVTIDDVYSGASQNREYFQTQVEIIKSREVAIKAIKKAELWNSEEFDPRPDADSMLTGLLVSVGLKDDPAGIEWNDDTLAEAIYPVFVKRVVIEPVRLSQLAKISFDSSSAALSARVANGLALAYIESDMDARYKVTQQASNWIQDRLASLRVSLEESERMLQQYREKAGIVDVKSVGQSGVGQQMIEVTSRLVEARLRRAEAENAYNQIKSAKKTGDLTSLPAVIRNPIVADALRQESQAERRLAELTQRYGTEHPKYMQAEGELKSARENLQRQVDTVVASITQEYEVNKGTERTLEGQMASARGGVQDINRKEFELTVLEREVESNRQIFDMFVKRAKETSISSDLQTPVARVVDMAVVPDRPVKPQKLQIILISFILGVFIATLAALVLERLDNTLKTSDDVETKLKTPLLTALPLLTDDEVARESTARIFIDNPKCLYSEAIRTARTGVLLSALDVPKRLLLITSSLPGEGKTTFSINLAMAHAHTKKTLLIDADMRRPAISKGLGLQPGAMGLSNLVSGTAKLEDCLQHLDGSSLDIMPSGSIPPNPVELLLSQKFKDTLDHLMEVYDVVIIDSPPVELVSDALVISPMATGVIYVSRANSTPWQLARRGLQRIRRAEGQLLGVVLNRLDFAQAEKYYGEYSGYGKYGYGQTGYGAVYGEDSSAV
ncbi:GumC family protein [Quatrionicoccus australiensis]|uniref:GumC family protein n=1 Tax=Quatrionicoccus australiensis TaxID=138118 RepID=UPI001CFAD32E|nr:polysaccharide biosynthesis tyrosine autokinase [Quatrionicoccus australiensis]MCB4358678.1 polysaccharide biosynthesis tyrosine autokinase [Quatrionicoccus australiensis]